eukprot:scaffold126813_cov63-Phaeocystis_antarctica.AAC.2
MCSSTRRRTLSASGRSSEWVRAPRANAALRPPIARAQLLPPRRLLTLARPTAHAAPRFHARSELYSGAQRVGAI